MLSIYGCDALEVPVALAEVEGVESGRALEVSVALTEVEGAELGGALEVPVVLRQSRGSGTGRGPCSGGYVWWQ